MVKVGNTVNHNNIEILSKNIPFASCNKAGPFSSRQAENPDGETTKTMHKKFLGWRRGRRLRFSVFNCSQKWQLVVGNTYLPIHICKYFSFCTITKFNNISFSKPKVFGRLCLPKLKSESWKHCRGRPPTLFWTFLTDGAQPQTFLVEVEQVVRIWERSDIRNSLALQSFFCIEYVRFFTWILKPLKLFYVRTIPVIWYR